MSSLCPQLGCNRAADFLYEALVPCGGKSDAGQNTNGYDDEEMTVELELEDGQMVNCAVITILTVDKKDYIALLPLDEDGNNDDG